MGTPISVPVYVDGRRADTVRSVTSDEELFSMVPQIVQSCTRKGLGGVKMFTTDPILNRVTEIHLYRAPKGNARSRRSVVIPIASRQKPKEVKCLRTRIQSQLV